MRDLDAIDADLLRLLDERIQALEAAGADRDAQVAAQEEACRAAGLPRGLWRDLVSHTVAAAHARRRAAR